MNRHELGKIAAKAHATACGVSWNENDHLDHTWAAGAAAVYHRAIEDAEAALDAADDEDTSRTMPEFREAFRAKLRGLIDAAEKPISANPDNYNIIIRRVYFEGKTLFEARVSELPDVTEYAESANDAYELALDTIQTTIEVFKLKGQALS